MQRTHFSHLTIPLFFKIQKYTRNIIKIKRFKNKEMKSIKQQRNQRRGRFVGARERLRNREKQKKEKPLQPEKPNKKFFYFLFLFVVEEKVLLCCHTYTVLLPPPISFSRSYRLRDFFNYLRLLQSSCIPRFKKHLGLDLLCRSLNLFR